MKRQTPLDPRDIPAMILFVAFLLLLILAVKSAHAQDDVPFAARRGAYVFAMDTTVPGPGVPPIDTFDMRIVYRLELDDTATFTRSFLHSDGGTRLDTLARGVLTVIESRNWPDTVIIDGVRFPASLNGSVYIKIKDFINYRSPYPGLHIDDKFHFQEEEATRVLVQRVSVRFVVCPDRLVGLDGKAVPVVAYRGGAAAGGSGRRAFSSRQEAAVRGAARSESLHVVARRSGVALLGVSSRKRNEGNRFRVGSLSAY